MKEMRERRQIEERFVKHNNKRKYRSELLSILKPIYRMKKIRERGRESKERFVKRYLTIIGNIRRQ